MMHHARNAKSSLILYDIGQKATISTHQELDISLDTVRLAVLWRGELGADVLVVLDGLGVIVARPGHR